MNTNSPYAQTVISEMMENEMSYEDAEKYVAEASYEQLNMEHPALTRSFVTAVEAFGYYFGLEDEDISKLINEMLGKTEPLTISTMMKNAYEMLDPNAQSREASIAIYSATSRVHNQWVADNSHRFFEDRVEKGRQYQYLPLELIGWQEASVDMDYVSKVAEALQLPVNIQDIRAVWEESSISLLKLCDIDNNPHIVNENGDIEPVGYRNLHELIVNGCEGYEKYWTPEIEAAFQNHPFVENIIIPQLEEKGIGSDEEFIRQLDELGINPFDNDDHEQVITRD